MESRNAGYRAGMSLMLGFLLTTSASGGPGLDGLVRYAEADDLSYAVRVAIEGPGASGVEVLGHDWNIKQAQISRDSDHTYVQGQLSHRLRFREDDQVFYQIVKRGRRVETVSVNYFGDRTGKWRTAARTLVDQIARAVR